MSSCGIRPARRIGRRREGTEDTKKTNHGDTERTETTNLQWWVSWSAKPVRRRDYGTRIGRITADLATCSLAQQAGGEGAGCVSERVMGTATFSASAARKKWLSPSQGRSDTQPAPSLPAPTARQVASPTCLAPGSDPYLALPDSATTKPSCPPRLRGEMFSAPSALSVELPGLRGAGGFDSRSG